jgi:ubiquitin C-terminal hydrolase
VSQCLQHYLQGEPLTGDNQYYCDTCNAKRDAQREQQLCSVPPILTLQLVRFEYDFAEGRRRKIRAGIHVSTTSNWYVRQVVAVEVLRY